MSYDLHLADPITGEILLSDEPHLMRGGTCVVGGTRCLELNVTYNYSIHLCRVLGEEGVRGLYGKSGAESIPLLSQGIDQLGDDVSRNYWEATEGNAKMALIQLRAMALMRPDGIWKGQ